MDLTGLGQDPQVEFGEHGGELPRSIKAVNVSNTVTVDLSRKILYHG
jgi:hypothetical protein